MNKYIDHVGVKYIGMAQIIKKSKEMERIKGIKEIYFTVKLEDGKIKSYLTTHNNHKFIERILLNETFEVNINSWDGLVVTSISKPNTSVNEYNIKKYQELNK